MGFPLPSVLLPEGALRKCLHGRPSSLPSVSAVAAALARSSPDPLDSCLQAGIPGWLSTVPGQFPSGIKQIPSQFPEQATGRRLSS